MDSLFSSIATNPTVVGFENELTGLLQNPISQTIIIMFLSLYAGKAAPQLEPSVQVLFSSTIFRLIIYILVAYTATHDLQVSLVTSIIMYFGAEMLTKEHDDDDDDDHDDDDSDDEDDN